MTDQDFREEVLQRIKAIEIATGIEGGIHQRLCNAEKGLAALWGWQRIIIIALVVTIAGAIIGKYI